MHLTRPKSSKGRSRASVRPPDGIQSAALTPKPPVEHSRPDSYLRSQSHTMIRQTHQMRQESQDEVVHMLQFGPSPPALSLNKYMVLPSIEKRRSELTMEKGPNKLSDNFIRHQQHRHTEPNLPTAPITQSKHEMGNVADVNCRVSLMPPESYLKPETIGEPPTAGPRGSFLLAIRVPCGRRFEQRYLFTDTLLTVIASAEARYGTMYGGGFIETMDVPRQTFTDLDMTLAQCGILNRSLLCISQEDSSVDYA